MIVDVHCHLTAPEFEKDLDNVVKRAKDIVIVTSGVNIVDNKKVLELCKRYKNVRAGLGLYPIDALELDYDELEESLEFIKKNKSKIVYVGEVGLDYKESDNFKKQKENFFRIISFVEKIKKPIVIHSRKAEEDCIDMLKSSSLKNIMFHSFTGKIKLVKKISDNGWGMSVPTSVVRSEQFQKLVSEIDLSQLFTETDAPFMSPFSGKRNEPCFVVESLKKISEIKKIEIEETEKILHVNFQKMFM